MRRSLEYVNRVPGGARARVVTAVAGILAVVALLAAPSPVAAVVTGGITVSPTSIAPGATATVTATFNETTGDEVIEVALAVAPAAGATGTVSLALDSFAGAAKCVLTDPTLVECLWVSGDGPAGSVTVTATASADALGTFEFTTTQDTRDAAGLITPDRPVAGPTGLVVEEPPPPTVPTTTTTTTTATAPSSSSTTAVPTTSTPASAGGTSGTASGGATRTPAPLRIAG
jgi:hypothetical protein